MSPAHTGRLLIVPAPLDHGCEQQAPLTDVLPDATLRAAAGLQHWIAENAKSTRAYLKRVEAIHPLCVPLQAVQIEELPRTVHKQGDHAGQRTAARGKAPGKSSQATPAFDPKPLLAPAMQGRDVGLVSEAGMPGIADPGSSVVRAAHALGLEVVPLVGPVSLLLALAASGLNGQSFAFVGYLPQDDAARAAALRQLEQRARQTGQAQILIETPYRNARLWQACLQHLQPGTWLSIAAGISLPGALYRSQSVQDWRRGHATCPVDGKTPAVFMLGC